MILVDSGPLMTLFLARDQYHVGCISTLRTLPDEPLHTTIACLTEALYFLGKCGGYAAQSQLWRMRREGDLIVTLMSEVVLDRTEDLMAKYADHSMDFADATLVATAEALGANTVFTLDRHFHSYALLNGKHLRVIP